MSRRYKKSRPVDPDKLRKALSSRNLTHSQVSRDMGFSESFISTVLNKGYIAEYGTVLLDRLFNIKYEDYKLDEPKPEEKKEKPVQETMPISETVIVTKTELQLKTIIAQLGELNNNILAMNSLLERIDKDIKVWEE